MANCVPLTLDMRCLIVGVISNLDLATDKNPKIPEVPFQLYYFTLCLTSPSLLRPDSMVRVAWGIEKVRVFMKHNRI